MTVLGALAKRSSLENPSVPLSASGLSDWLSGGKVAGVSVSEKDVWGIPAYYRAAALVAGTLAALPIKVYKRGSRERIRQRTVLDSPNPRQRPVAFWLTTFANASTWGNAYALKRRNGAGVVVETWPIHPSRIRVETVEPDDHAPDGKIFIYSDRTGSPKVLTSWEVFHLPYMSLDGVTGLSPLQSFRRSLGVGLAAEQAAAATFANGNRLTGVISTKDELSETAANKLKKRWRDLYGGPASAGDVAVLDNSAEFSAISIPPADAQLLESRQWTVTEIARMFGLPPHLLGDTERSTSWGTGIEQQFIAWVQTNLGLWIRLAEELMTADLLPGGWDFGDWYAEIDLNGLLRGDSAQRAAYYHQQITDGMLSPNEGRAKENMEPVEGGDDFMLPAGVMPVRLAEMQSKINQLGVLVRAGFEPSASAIAVGLKPIDHTGLVPITVTLDPSQSSGAANAAPAS